MTRSRKLAKRIQLPVTHCHRQLCITQRPSWKVKPHRCNCKDRRMHRIRTLPQHCTVAHGMWYHQRSSMSTVELVQILAFTFYPCPSHHTLYLLPSLHLTRSVSRLTPSSTSACKLRINATPYAPLHCSAHYLFFTPNPIVIEDPRKQSLYITLGLSASQAIPTT